jgi:hypothetical protein
VIVAFVFHTTFGKEITQYRAGGGGQGGEGEEEKEGEEGREEKLSCL